jgi:adenine-specific DNA-methyltransferase
MAAALGDKSLLGKVAPTLHGKGPELSAIRSELNRARILCRAWSATVSEDQRADQAAEFSRQTLMAFSRVIAPRFRLSTSFGEPRCQLDGSASTLAETIGRQAAHLDIVEGLYFIAGLYPLLLPARERSARGAFYTPSALVTRLLQQATEQKVDWRTARVLDPAAGGGAFLINCAVRMRESLMHCAPAFVLAQIESRLLGFEVDARAARLAQIALEILLADLSSECGRAARPMVRVCDTLSAVPSEAFDLVVGNPPYGRITLSQELRRRYARSLYGHANLYGVFTDAALQWTKPGGVIAFLTPTSFLAGQYYAALRGVLAQEAPPAAIDFIHARRGVFDDVLQETLLATYRKGGQRARVQINYLDVSEDQDITVSRNGTIALPCIPTFPWLAPRDPSHGALISRVEKMGQRLADWGYAVSTGPLVWNRFKSQLRSTLDGPSIYPLIWAEAVTSDGQFKFRALKKNHAPYFELKAGDAWLLVQQPCILVQRTTAKEQARRLIATELPVQFIKKHDGVVVENHLNMVRPKGRAKVPLNVVAALLNSRIVDEVFRCMNGSVAVSAYELEALPLPEVEHLDALTQLVARGAERGRIEVECDRLYGLI